MANIFEKNKTYLGDCLELMPQMESGIFDMILCDLPYGSTVCKWDAIIPFEPLWKEYERLIKPNGAIVLFCSQPFTSLLITSNLKIFKYALVWDKKAVTNPMLAKKQFLRCHEDIVVFYKKQPTYNPQMRSGTKWSRGGKKQHETYIHGQSTLLNNGSDKSEIKYPKSILTFSNADKTKNIHPTQKPIALFENLIRTYTNEGELILDNCAGGGTTGEACYNTGRNYIQIEREQDYFSLILGREKSFNKKDYGQKSLFETEM